MDGQEKLLDYETIKAAVAGEKWATEKVLAHYCNAPLIDALTDDRQQIFIRGRRYTAPPLTSTCSVVCQSYKEIISEGK